MHASARRCGCGRRSRTRRCGRPDPAACTAEKPARPPHPGARKSAAAPALLQLRKSRLALTADRHDACRQPWPSHPLRFQRPRRRISPNFSALRHRRRGNKLVGIRLWPSPAIWRSFSWRSAKRLRSNSDSNTFNLFCLVWYFSHGVNLCQYSRRNGPVRHHPATARTVVTSQMLIHGARHGISYPRPQAENR